MPRSLAPVALAVALLPGCLDHILEAPFVLTPGLGEARSIAPTDRNTMLVAASSGLHEVDGEGQPTRLWEGEAHAVSTHEARAYALAGDTLRVGSLDAASGTWTWQARPLQGARDLLAWCDERLLGVTHGEVIEVDPSGASSPSTWLEGQFGLRGLSLDAARPCEGVLVFSDHQLLFVSPEGEAEVILERQVELRAVATDGDHRTWIVHGTPPRLSVLVDGKPQTFAHYLGDPRDIHFGTGALLKPDNIYLADGGGTLDYLRVVAPAGGGEP